MASTHTVAQCGKLQGLQFLLRIDDFGVFFKKWLTFAGNFVKGLKDAVMNKTPTNSS